MMKLRYYHIVCLLVSVTFFISCKKNSVVEDDFVKLESSELIGKYVINYDVFVSEYYNVLPNSLKNFTDTFQLKESVDKSSLEWRSNGVRKILEFSINLTYLPKENKGYKMAKISFFMNDVKYIGQYDTITQGKNWNVYNSNSSDEMAYFIKRDGLIKLDGTDLKGDAAKAHLRTSSTKEDGNEWRLKFRILSCDKIQ